MSLLYQEYCVLTMVIGGGFQSWVSRRCVGVEEYPIWWGPVIAETVIGDNSASWKDMNDDDSERASSLLIDLLLSYCGECTERICDQRMRVSSINGIAEMADHLKHRPRMLIPDEKYLTLVAFISGMLMVWDENKRFQSWVSRQCSGLEEHPRAWEVIVAETVVGDELAGSVDWRDLNDADSERASSLLVDLLISYCEEYSDKSDPPKFRINQWKDAEAELSKIVDPEAGFVALLRQGRFDAEWAERILVTIGGIDITPSDPIPIKLLYPLRSFRAEIRSYLESVDGEQRLQAADYSNRLQAIVSEKTRLVYS